MLSAQRKRVSSLGIYVILASIVAAGVLMILDYDVAGSIVFLIGFFVGLMIILYPALFSGTETEQKGISQANTEDFKKRLSLIISEGSSIVQGVESTSLIINFGKVVLPFVLEKKDLDSLERFVEGLNLPSPVHQIYLRYIQWNRDCEGFFSEFGLDQSYQFEEFVRLRREISKEMSKENPYQRAILFKIKEQLSVVDSLSKPNLTKLRREQIPSRKKVGSKLVFVLAYVSACLIVDIVLCFYNSYYAIALATLEAAILFGFPKLLEWILR